MTFLALHTSLTEQLNQRRTHQPPAVNYIEVLANVDLPCIVHLRMYHAGGNAFCENLDTVHFRWLVDAHPSRRQPLSVRAAASRATKRALSHSLITLCIHILVSVRLFALCTPLEPSGNIEWWLHLPATCVCSSAAQSPMCPQLRGEAPIRPPAIAVASGAQFVPHA